MFELRQLPAFVEISACSFPMGTPERELSALAKAYGGTRESYREESPQHIVALSAFAIAKTPVTNAQYAAFVAATGARAPITWRGPQPPSARLDHPVVDVSWEEANMFCTWLTTAMQDEGFALRLRSEQATKDESVDRTAIRRLSSFVFRLPTEAEWERAARGVDGRTFAWGDVWDGAKANTRDRGAGGTTAVDAHPHGASLAGCLDMAGNVWEWTASLDALYPYLSGDGREDPRAPGRRILRGGCFANPPGFARCACRFRLPPNVRNEFLGFRLATTL
jgi:formylglycine-generating enzyme required for sulfatase activity